MNKTKTLVRDREKINALVKLAFLVGIVVVAPIFHNQLLTGTVVNATLFVATALLGVRMAMFVALVPSIIALSVGTLPAPLMPMIPYIMLSNIILISVFNFFKDKNYWAAMVTASFLKFLFLLLSSSVLVGLIMKKELVTNVAAMMTWPQLLTALLGGVLAKVFLDFYRGRK